MDFSMDLFCCKMAKLDEFSKRWVSISCYLISLMDSGLMCRPSFPLPKQQRYIDNYQCMLN